MKTTYLIWKDSSCRGAIPDWQEITGAEFLSFVRSPEGKSRHFIKLPSNDNDGDDGVLVMEATEAAYLEWKREKNHADYLRSYGKDITVVSYQAMESDNGECFGEELLRDDGRDVEFEYFALFDREGVRVAVSRLSDNEQKIIEYLYLSESRGTERGYSALTGIPQKTINDRKKRAIAKLLNTLQ